MVGIKEAWNALFLLGSVNSLFLGLLLLRRQPKEQQKANRYISIILFSWAFGFFYTWMIETEMYRSYPHILLLGASFTFLTGPCLYLYAEKLLPTLTSQSQEERQKAIRGIQGLHFLPFLINTLALVPFYFSTGEDKLRYWDLQLPQDKRFFVMKVLQLLHLGIYLVLLQVRLRTHRSRLRENVSTEEGLTLNWLRNLILLGFVGLSSYVIVMLFFQLQTGNSAFINRFTDLVVLGILHILGFEALMQPSFLQKKVAPYARSPLGEQEVQALARKIEEHMRSTQAYLDENLTLRDLSMEMNLSPHHVSQVINQAMGINFFEFINRERVRHAQKILDAQRQKPVRSISLLDVAFESGFRSKSTFNSLFKRYTGLTPSQYKKGKGG
ncbi:MAG: helix-turn-helix transcriptional regulator [Spirochaetales bacterium]